MLSTSGMLELFIEPKADNRYLFYYFAPELDYEYRGTIHLYET
jgi:hypothetical protein